jgi:hypothetical protein
MYLGKLKLSRFRNEPEAHSTPNPARGWGMITDVESTSDDPSLFVLESCHSTWIFDTDRMRFRRVLKGLALDAHAATTAWRPYFGLEIDPISESFVVMLNPEGTRLLRSWRHVEHCPQCGGNQTAELSLDELRSASLA